MHNEVKCRTGNYSSRFLRGGAITLSAMACLASAGCLSSLQNRSAALSVATAPVIDEAVTAYHSANELHDTWLDYDAVGRFDNKQTVYNPESIQPLMSEHGINVRLAVLEAFKCYVQSLVDITNGVNSHQMDAAAAFAGMNLTAVANDVAPSIEKTLGIAAAGSTVQKTVAVTSGNTTTTTVSHSTTPAPDAISPAVRNGISTAASALGQFLVSHKIKKELPSKIKAMDEHLETLCKLLEEDIAVIRSQEKMDYENILDSQTLFLRVNTLQPQERREQIMKLPEMVRQRRATEDELDELSESIRKAPPGAPCARRGSRRPQSAINEVKAR